MAIFKSRGTRERRERERKRERVRAMTQPSFAVGIVVSVRVRRAKEQVGCDGGGRGEPGERRAVRRQREGRGEKVAKGGNKRRSRMSGN